MRNRCANNGRRIMIIKIRRKYPFEKKFRRVTSKLINIIYKTRTLYFIV